MKRGKLAVVAVAVVAVAIAAALVVRSLGAGTPSAAPPRPLSPEEARAAEARLLDERAFSHPVDVAAPDVSVVGPDGRALKLSALRGKVLFVNFWATWCPPCIDEMPSMVQLGRELATAYPDRFQMVAISGDDTWEAVHDYFGKAFGGVPSAVTLARDPDTAAARAYYCTARGYCPDIKFPETYIVDRSGRIVAMIVGPREWSDPAARKWLEFLIRG